MRTAFYLIASLPAIMGVALIAVGIWVVCRFKHDDTQDKDSTV